MYTDFLQQLEQTLKERKQADAKTSYTASLYAAGEDKILQKLGEESFEVTLAAKSGERVALIHEMADLWYHTLVLLAWHGVDLAEVITELQNRESRSGLQEKSERK